MPAVPQVRHDGIPPVPTLRSPAAPIVTRTVELIPGRMRKVDLGGLLAIIWHSRVLWDGFSGITQQWGEVKRESKCAWYKEAPRRRKQSGAGSGFWDLAACESLASITHSKEMKSLERTLTRGERHDGR